MLSLSALKIKLQKTNLRPSHQSQLKTMMIRTMQRTHKVRKARTRRIKVRRKVRRDPVKRRRRPMHNKMRRKSQSKLMKLQRPTKSSRKTRSQARKTIKAPGNILNSLRIKTQSCVRVRRMSSPRHRLSYFLKVICMLWRILISSKNSLR